MNQVLNQISDDEDEETKPSFHIRNGYWIYHFHLYFGKLLSGWKTDIQEAITFKHLAQIIIYDYVLQSPNARCKIIGEKKRKVT